MTMVRRPCRLSRSAKTRARRETAKTSGGESGRRGAGSTIERSRQQRRSERRGTYGNETTNDIANARAGRDQNLLPTRLHNRAESAQPFGSLCQRFSLERDPSSASRQWSRGHKVQRCTQGKRHRTEGNEREQRSPRPARSHSGSRRGPRRSAHLELARCGQNATCAGVAHASDLKSPRC